MHVPVFLTNKRCISLFFLENLDIFCYHVSRILNTCRKSYKKPISERIYLIVDGQTFLQTGVVKISLQKTFTYCKEKFIWVLDMSCKNIVWHTHVFFAYTMGSKSLHSRYDFSKYFLFFYFIKN